MFNYSMVFSGFSVKNIQEARAFYGKVLGFSISDNPMGVLELKIPGGNAILIYPKADHQPAVFTVLNIPVEDIDSAVDHLVEKGIQFEHYGGEIETDARGICRNNGNGPELAWFKDPSGNIISLIEIKD